jgi:molecular chaperone GrpE
VKRSKDAKDDDVAGSGAAGEPAVAEPPLEEEARGMAAVGPEPASETVDSLRRERDELKDRLLRRTADFDNYRKRVERDRQQAGTEAVAALLKALVPTLDNLDRALEADGSDASLREGVELIRRDLLSALEARGVTAENPAGARFNPLRHQALAHEPAPGFADGTVVEVLRKGYSFADKLLRPALVKVAKGDEPAPDKVH